MRNHCRSYIRCTLKIINSILTVVGIGIICYSLWMLKKWQTQQHSIHTLQELGSLPSPWYTIFATHMDRLPELASIYPNVKVCHFQVDVKGNRMDFKFSLKEGHISVPHYGLLLAGIAGLPNSVVEEARRVTQNILEKETRRLEQSHMQYLSLRKEYRVAQRVLCLKYANLTEEDLRSSLQTLKESFIDGRL